ncbi:MAG TPA: hypothetical protein VJL84_05190 [Kiloniellales bacterium]|nr:hypothetical protein [Kiloniellales bacterium]
MIELVERPDEMTWEERRRWLADAEAAASGGGATALSEQAIALTVELQRCFCAGAWAAVLILAGAIVDAQSLYAGFPFDRHSEDRAWLRSERNRLMHEDRQRPALTVEDLWLKEPERERAAKRATRLALVALYAGGR